MDFLRRTANPWSQDILIGVAWDLLWAALFAGILFVVVHALYVAVMAPVPEKTDQPIANVPEKIERHSGASRSFHWLMALSMLVLLVTAFFPLVGIQFAWVTIHWVAGLVLTLLIIYHIWDTTVRKDWRTIWIGKKEIRQAIQSTGQFLRRKPAKEGRTGKYPLDQRAYHNATTLVSVGAIITGLLMTFRIDTWFWTSNPYFLSDATWGLVFILHGLCGVALITLVIAHVYFAIRPEKRWMTRSMIKGWITREEYLEHYDPEQWKIGDGEPAHSESHGLEEMTDVPPSDPGAVAPA